MEITQGSILEMILGVVLLLILLLRSMVVVVVVSFVVVAGVRTACFKVIIVLRAGVDRITKCLHCIVHKKEKETAALTINN